MESFPADGKPACVRPNRRNQRRVPLQTGYECDGWHARSLRRRAWTIARTYNHALRQASGTCHPIFSHCRVRISRPRTPRRRALRINPHAPTRPATRGCCPQPCVSHPAQARSRPIRRSRDKQRSRSLPRQAVPLLGSSYSKMSSIPLVVLPSDVPKHLVDPWNLLLYFVSKSPPSSPNSLSERRFKRKVNATLPCKGCQGATGAGATHLCKSIPSPCLPVSSSPCLVPAVCHWLRQCSSLHSTAHRAPANLPPPPTFAWPLSPNLVKISAENGCLRFAPHNGRIDKTSLCRRLEQVRNLCNGGFVELTVFRWRLTATCPCDSH